MASYHLLQRLSRRPGPTEVWAARRSDGTVVAAKLLTEEGRNREDLKLRFEQEGRWLVRLGGWHNVIACHEVIAQPPGLILELAEGGSVRDLIHPRSGAPPVPLAVPLVLRIAQQTIHALAWLHHHDVIHRDVKPSNLLLMADGTIRLSDLGVAAVGRPPRGLPSGWIEEDIGTLGYTAPELLRDPSTATPAVDVYGLGVTLYEMLSGELPYRMGVSETELELRERIVAGERPVPLIGRAEIPNRLAGIVMQAIDPDASARFANLDQLARALGQAFSW